MGATVILGELGEIMRVGLGEALADAGIGVVADIDLADAVLIDLDAADVELRAAELADSFPGVAVIACSAQRPAMRVLRGPGAGAERPLTQHGLGACVRAAAAAGPGFAA